MIRPRFLGRLAWFFVTVLNWSVRIRIIKRKSADTLLSEKENVLFAFFHGDMVPLLHAYRNSHILIPASESRDGEIMAQLLKNFGFDVVRGSSKRKGHKALRQLITGMRKGKTVAIPVDGPRGPLHVVKPGIVYLAGLLKVPIVPAAVSARRFRILEKSWDHLMIPVPFTECIVLYGDPIYVNGTADEEINEVRQKLEAYLHELRQQAHSIFPKGHTSREYSEPG